MSMILLAIGLVLVVEGLALALAPSRLEQLLAAFVSIPVERRRLIGLSAVAVGTALIAVFKSAGT